MSNIQATIRISGGKIQAIEPQFGGVTVISEREEIHYPGAWLMPGFVDSHAHIAGLGEALFGLSLDSAQSAEECVAMCSAHSGYQGNWLSGRGWNQEMWFSKHFPDRSMLDAQFPDIPVYLRRADGHAAWVNSAALRIAGINERTPNPPGGVILRDEKKNPTGILIDNAMELVSRYIPKHSPERIREFIRVAGEECAKLGITEVHDMDVDLEYLDIFRESAEKGTLPIRVQSAVRGQYDEWLRAGILPAVGEFFRLFAVKLYADGALGSRGAYLLSPYSDDAKTRGLELLTEEQMFDKAKKIVEFDWNICIHAIGDAANRSVLNVYQRLRESGIANPHTILRVEHAQIIHPTDIDRFSAYQVIPSVQPIHCTSDAKMARLRLGERTHYAYPWRTLRNSGSILPAGSDFPIESPNPLLGIDAFCRRTPTGEDSAWEGQERITRGEALKAYTEWAHESADMNYRRGYLRPKFDADFIVLDRNLLTCSDDDVLSTQILATYSGGVLRYKK